MTMTAMPQTLTEILRRRRRRWRAARPRPILDLPTVPYPATVTRPGWPDLPDSVRDVINSMSHQPVTGWQSSRAGFTPAFASTLTHADGSHSFAKAAPVGTAAADAYRREAGIAGRLPLGVPSARLRWHAEHDGWQVRVFDNVAGSVLEPGWSTDLAQPVIAAWRQAADALAKSGSALWSAAVRPQRLPAGWNDIATGRAALPPHASHLARLAPVMRTWEAGFLTACGEATTLAHFDLRPDNLLANPMGRVWIVDWATLQPAPDNVDAVILAIAASDDGTDPQSFFDTASPDTNPRHLDQALAWLAGAWLTYAAGPARPDSGHLRAHQLRHGLLAWQWLAARHDLPTAPLALASRSPAAGAP